MTTTQTTLDTVEIGLKPSDLLNILLRHDSRGEGWSFAGNEDAKSVQCRTLELWVDSSSTPTQIRLNADGTWSATTHHLLGEA